MPNFIAKNLKNRAYPFGKDDVEFLWEASDKSHSLIYTKSGDESFFIVKKQDQKSQNFIIKGEKLTKPAKIGLLQKALLIYKDENTSQIISEAMAYKPAKLPKNGEFILNINTFIDDFNELKSRFSKIFIEIGFGSGRHLLFQAKNHENALVIGIEVYKPSIEQVAKLAIAQNLKNVRVINTDARLILSLIDSNLVDKIFLHFPVPWDKQEHRRVVSAEFVNECQRVLKMGGNFELRTDSREYFDFSLALFLNLKNAKIALNKNENLEISSKYEDRWRKQEKDIYDLIFTCENESLKRENLAEFEFKNSYDLAQIKQNFKDSTYKDDEIFVHFEKLYVGQDRLIIKVAFGAFNKPEHCYLKLENGTCEYFIKKPLLTKQNLKAHRILEDTLAKCKV
ncbi:tRNA (guanosine(46)-N7)-methyltransferase TrmB [Campylobacter gastrosuis]|uniref:tRNA (guanine-N(7)-)-methyltransferase n=1 Tax=Campylobacter gastrosuis TaxID=2974576 RepID=A0ABT7HPV4_9BACT|nr:tRNA (guanosine(46)-N7)-methyltransferase TrmB [Campylobacter gastrosuis]MDL0088429.1 tRNA (guanosine(46)-N7)-methyltransferase TrmB [Campylobacter gastrosuis]